MNQNVDIHDLAKATQELVKRQSYGKLRSKLEKNGFSEIALYKAITDHCDENGIKPASMAKEMLALLEGCAVNAFFPKISNDFTFLRGLYYELRYAEDSQALKCPEQRGKFLCNRCYCVKNREQRSKHKSTRNSCNDCTKEINKINNASYIKRQQEVSEKMVEAELPNVPVQSEPEILEENIMAQDSQEIVVTKPEPQLMPKVERVVITEVMADAEEANISIKCQTKFLADVLHNLKQI